MARDYLHRNAARVAHDPFLDAVLRKCNSFFWLRVIETYRRESRATECGLRGVDELNRAGEATNVRFAEVSGTVSPLSRVYETIKRRNASENEERPGSARRCHFDEIVKINERVPRKCIRARFSFFSDGHSYGTFSARRRFRDAFSRRARRERRWRQRRPSPDVERLLIGVFADKYNVTFRADDMQLYANAQVDACMRIT